MQWDNERDRQGSAHNNKWLFVWFRRTLPGIKASFSFDLHEIVFDSDPIEAGPPLWMEGKCVQMNIAKNLNRFPPAIVQEFNIIIIYLLFVNMSFLYLRRNFRL